MTTDSNEITFGIQSLNMDENERGDIKPYLKN